MSLGFEAVDNVCFKLRKSVPSLLDISYMACCTYELSQKHINQIMVETKPR